MALFTSLLNVGCGGQQPAVQDSHSCKRELSSCQFELENLRARHWSQGAYTGEQAESYGFLEEWRSAYADISARLEAMFRGYDYRIEVDNGALVFGLPLETLFLHRKATLTEQGREVALRVNQIAKQVDGRRLMVVCRSVDHRTDKPGSKAAADRELSFKRAMAFTTKLVSTGIDPATLGAAGYPGDVDEESGEGEGRFEFVVLPFPNEMPGFPDDFLPQSEESTPPGR
jgi:outer membrane protein OmpA-like peptidoglycan-associated protein